MAPKQRKKKTPPKAPIKTAEPAQKRAGVGRPTLYAPAMNSRALNLSLAGFNREEIAIALEIGITTFDRWMMDHPLFRGAVTRGREEADGRVARALYKRALGMKVKKQQAVKIRTGMDESVEIVDITEELPPDTGAATNWLSCRQRGKWGKDKKEVAQDESRIKEFLAATGETNMDDLFSEEAIN